MAKDTPRTIDKAEFPIFGIADKVWRKYPPLRGDCSGYLRQVARDTGIELPALLANPLIAYFQTAPSWLKLGNDAAKAALLSTKGYFVVGGETEAGHGHVVVVVPGWSPNGYPMGYWGKLGGVGFEDQALNYAWIGAHFWNSARGMAEHPHAKSTPSPLSQVLYFAFLTPRLARISK